MIGSVGESRSIPRLTYTHAIRNPCSVSIAGALSLSDLSRQLENYLVNQYLVSPHSQLVMLLRPDGKRAGFFPRSRIRWRSLICYCSPYPKRCASVRMEFIFRDALYRSHASCLCRRRVLEADHQATLRYRRPIEHIPTCNSPKRV